MQKEKSNRRRGFKINHNAYTDIVNIQPVVYIRSKKNPLLFYNEFHKEFFTLNLADMFTTKKANELINKLGDCEKITLDKICADNPSLKHNGTDFTY